MTTTTISWTDKTWNVTRGCRRVSPGCENCYAERQANRFAGKGGAYEGLIKHVGSGARWSGETRFAVERLADPLRWRKPCRIFVDSMSDLFYEGFTNEHIAAVFGVMAACPQHTFQVLTKRARRMREWFAWLDAQSDPMPAGAFEYLDETACDALAGHYDCCHLGLMTSQSIRWPLPNVWLGVSVEDQERADERIPELLRTPAVVRFLSCEPLLGPVNLRHLDDDAKGGAWCQVDALAGTQTDMGRPCPPIGARVDWVIAGCESGPGARPCDVAWLRSLRDQCAAAGVAYFLKQAVEAAWSRAVYPSARAARVMTVDVGIGDGSKTKGRGHGGAVIELPYLDGVQHAAFPEVRP